MLRPPTSRATPLPVLLVALAMLVPAPGRAAGGHDKAGCVGCHGQGNAVLGNTAFCLRCHSTKEEGGKDILPISRHVSHPYGSSNINSRVAKVPPELLREGRLECLSCHDPHPSNPNSKYLRVETGPADRYMDAFCAICHPSKSDQAPRMPDLKK